MLVDEPDDLLVTLGQVQGSNCRDAFEAGKAGGHPATVSKSEKAKKAVGFALCDNFKSVMIAVVLVNSFYFTHYYFGLHSPSSLRSWKQFGVLGNLSAVTNIHHLQMSETVNTQQMAQILSEPVFSTFGWVKVGPSDVNWACVEQGKHDRKKSKTHSSDAVFRYYDPYRGLDVYLNTDLKSYKSGTLEKTDLSSTLRQLARATECSNKSEEWAKLFANESKNWEVAGLLFIYNHDGQYDKDFGKVLMEVHSSEVPVAEGQCVHVLGPKDICYLNTVALDIDSARGRKSLPNVEFCGFYYPDLEDAIAAKSRKHQAATIEQMLGPWQLLRYDKLDPVPIKCGYYFYYRGQGRGVDEFKYLIDYLFKYQLLGDWDEISIRMPFACADAAAIFERAKIQYQEDFWSVGNASPEAFGERLKRITCHPLTSIKEQFSTTAIGMKKK